VQIGDMRLKKKNVRSVVDESAMPVRVINH
jgi:hypothetical protein